ncbi:hypothetical protein RB628_27460 [Streptomyces sp. ADMS]|uniref:hypothetical protein n=1 Tax=Streptomyces sp. ADMS TaxID=3071415 RepID=UPI00296F7117|nr:hypothetical protein [Streptomyces sp. ADMS]MDW4908974.1 hypothetical protein [Streptomyces sp. ADMS]
MRVWVRGLVAGAVALGVVGGGGFAGADTGGPEADLAYHGAVSLDHGRLDLRVTPRNHGPSAVADATVRLTLSAPLAARQQLPHGCARLGARVVVCRTGALAADGVGDQIGLRLRLRGTPSEALLEIDTVWGGDVVDRNRDNDQQRVLVLDTGDAYYF